MAALGTPSPELENKSHIEIVPDTPKPPPGEARPTPTNPRTYPVQPRDSEPETI
jgi:hypothetical protein